MIAIFILFSVASAATILEFSITVATLFHGVFYRPTFDLSSRAVEEVLLRCDYHGCKVRVSQSKCPSYVGLSGIIAQDTRDVFKIITKEDKLKSMLLCYL